jgi:hypothetical protein
LFGLDAFVGLTGAASGRQAVHTRIGAGGIELFLRPASGGDISLIPFAGLGSLAAAAEAALPFLLDKLATVPGTVGDLVQTVRAFRRQQPKHFDGAALQRAASLGRGVGALSIATTGLTTSAAPRRVHACGGFGYCDDQPAHRDGRRFLGVVEPHAGIATIVATTSSDRSRASPCAEPRLNELSHRGPGCVSRRRHAAVRHVALGSARRTPYRRGQPALDDTHPRALGC